MADSYVSQWHKEKGRDHYKTIIRVVKSCKGYHYKLEYCGKVSYKDVSWISA